MFKNELNTFLFICRENSRLYTFVIFDTLLLMSRLFLRTLQIKFSHSALLCFGLPTHIIELPPENKTYYNMVVWIGARHSIVIQRFIDGLISGVMLNVY